MASIDQILKKNFGLTGKAESFTRKPKKLKKFNSERMMSAYAYLINDKYKQIAEAALLRADVMTMKARGEADETIMTKVKNAGKDLWRLIKKLLTRLVNFIQEMVIKVMSKARTAKKLANKFRKLLGSFVKSKLNDGDTLSIKVPLDDAVVQEINKKIAPDFNEKYYNPIKGSFLGMMRGWGRKDYKSDVNIADFIKNNKDTVDTADLEAENKVLKDQLDAATKAEMNQFELVNVLQVKCCIAYSIKYLDDQATLTKEATVKAIKEKNNCNNIKNAPTSVTKDLTPEQLQIIRKIATLKAEKMNIERKKQEILLNKTIKNLSELFKSATDLLNGKVKTAAGSLETTEAANDVVEPEIVEEAPTDAKPVSEPIKKVEEKAEPIADTPKEAIIMGAPSNSEEVTGKVDIQAIVASVYGVETQLMKQATDGSKTEGVKKNTGKNRATATEIVKKGNATPTNIGANSMPMSVLTPEQKKELKYLTKNKKMKFKDAYLKVTGRSEAFFACYGNLLAVFG